MNQLVNNVKFIGNLGADPEVKTFENGNKLVKFSLATTENIKTKDGYAKDTQWHPIVLWGSQANFAEQYLVKGSRIILKGRLVHRTYEDSNGDKKYITEIVASEIMTLASKTEKTTA